MAIWGRTMRLTMLVAVAALAGAAIVSACGSSSNDNNHSAGGSPQASNDDLTARLQQDELLYAWLALAANSPHEYDTSLQNGTIDSKYVPTLRTFIRVSALTPWPDTLKADATKFHDDAVTLYQGLNAGKTADELKDASMAVHEDWHTFTPEVGNQAAKSLPADAGGPEASHDSTSSTPSDGTSTPASDTHH